MVKEIRNKMTKSKKQYNLYGQEILQLSKYDFIKMYGNDYHLHNYNCELCGENHSFYEMSSCDRCQRFICDDCSEAVANRDNNPFGYDFFV